MPEDKQNDKRSREDEQRESGNPGGGAGRRDETGRSGVYPLSGPERPAGNAPLVNEEEWGQGERGSAGYEDSGRSEPFEEPEERRRREEGGEKGGR